MSACVSQELELAIASHKTLLRQQLYNRVSHGLPLLLFWHLLWEFMQAPCTRCFFVLSQLRLWSTGMQVDSLCTASQFLLLLVLALVLSAGAVCAAA